MSVRTSKRCWRGLRYGRAMGFGSSRCVTRPRYNSSPLRPISFTGANRRTRSIGGSSLQLIPENRYSSHRRQGLGSRLSSPRSAYQHQFGSRSETLMQGRPIGKSDHPPMAIMADDVREVDYARIPYIAWHISTTRANISMRFYRRCREYIRQHGGYSPRSRDYLSRGGQSNTLFRVRFAGFPASMYLIAPIIGKRRRESQRSWAETAKLLNAASLDGLYRRVSYDVLVIHRFTSSLRS